MKTYILAFALSISASYINASEKTHSDQKSDPSIYSSLDQALTHIEKYSKTKDSLQAKNYRYAKKVDEKMQLLLSLSQLDPSIKSLEKMILIKKDILDIIHASISIQKKIVRVQSYLIQKTESAMKAENNKANKIFIDALMQLHSQLEEDLIVLENNLEAAIDSETEIRSDLKVFSLSEFYLES